MEAEGRGRTSGGKRLDPGLARDFSELARALQAESETAALLQRIVDAAVTEVDGADHAGLSLISKGKVESPGSSPTNAAIAVSRPRYDCCEVCS